MPQKGQRSDVLQPGNPGDLHPHGCKILESSGLLDIPGQTNTNRKTKMQHKGGSTVDDPKQVLKDIRTMIYKLIFSN